MTSLKTALRRFRREESAATMVEYAIMVALIAVVCIAAVSALGGSANQKFTSVTASLN